MKCPDCGYYRDTPNHEYGCEHPSVTFYGSTDYRTAAISWRESAMEMAKEANALRDELSAIKRTWWYRLFGGSK